METKDSLENLRKEIDDLKRSNSIAVQLYKMAENDMDVLLAQHGELLTMYQKMHECNYNKLKDTITNYKTNSENPDLISSQYKEVLDLYSTIYDCHSARMKLTLEQLIQSKKERFRIASPQQLPQPAHAPATSSSSKAAASPRK